MWPGILSERRGHNSEPHKKLLFCTLAIDCAAGSVTVEGQTTHLPAHADCASGGIRAIDTLCPSYGGQIEIKD
jgi:hypothetical protein